MKCKLQDMHEYPLGDIGAFDAGLGSPGFLMRTYNLFITAPHSGHRGLGIISGSKVSLFIGVHTSYSL